MQNVTIVDHPLVMHKLTHLRKMETPSREFRELVKELSSLMAWEVTKHFPLKEIEVIQQQPFIEKVDQILALKEENPKADTTTLEKEIDAMVYELYGLTEEEIKIVEES